ncbi:hypothetical protein ABZP36_021753 [Zizania latifolia]
MVGDQACHLGVTVIGLAGRVVVVMKMVKKITEGVGSTVTTITVDLVIEALANAVIVATASSRAGANTRMVMMMITDDNQG